ncbi:MAG TPA: FkbM family methyltransferase [Terriglobales bacterium]|nr:FkbM family methyltransferase [Terriglobales bacterium]
MPVLKSRLKSSFIRDAYRAVANRERLQSLRREVDFYKSLLTGFERGDLVFDVGANEGAKTDVFLRLGARVIAIEPDDMSSSGLKERFLRLRIFPLPVTIVTQAVSDVVGAREMLVDGPGSAVNTMSPKWAESLKNNKATFPYGHCGLEFKKTKMVETTTIEELINRYGVPFFVKIDVEGHELSALRGLRRPVPYLSFEVNLPEFRTEGLECIRLLAGLAAAGRFNYTSDCIHGLALTEWVAADEFSAVLNQCSERSIEVFWKTDFAGTRTSGARGK